LRSSSAGTFNADVKMFYSIWLEPPVSVAKPTETFITEVTRKVSGTPKFLPHVTLLGAFERSSDDEAVVVLDQVCDRLRERELLPLECRPSSITCGQIRYQCVFLKLEKTASLTEAYEIADEIVSLPGASSDTFMPHMSLAYGIDDIEERLGVAKEAEDALFKGILSDVFNVAKISLWETDVSDLTCQSWRRVKGTDV